MTYPYGTKGAPAVGGGLPGLPRRSGGDLAIGKSGIIIHDRTKQGEPGSDLIPWGTEILRSDYPELSALLPPDHPEQIMGLPDFSVPIPSAGVKAYITAISPNEEFYAFAYSPTGSTSTNPARICKRVGDGWGDPVTIGANAAYSNIQFSANSEFLFLLRQLSSSKTLAVFKVNSDASTSQIGSNISLVEDSIFSLFDDPNRFFVKNGTTLRLYEIDTVSNQLTEISSITDSNLALSSATTNFITASPSGDLVLTSRPRNSPTRRELRAYTVHPVTKSFAYSSEISASLEDTDLLNGGWWHPSGDWVIRYSYTGSIRGPGINLFRRKISGDFEHTQFVPNPDPGSLTSSISQTRPECFSPDGRFFYSGIHLRVYGFFDGVLEELDVEIPSFTRVEQGLIASKHHLAASYTGNDARLFGIPYKALAKYSINTMFFRAK